MIGSQMPGITTTPFNVGQYGIGQFPNIGMGYGQFNIPIQTPGLWTGQYGMPGVGQMPGMQGLGMPGLGMPGLGGMQGLGIGQNLAGASPYGLFGGLGQQFGGGIFGGLGQQLGGGLFGGYGPNQGFGMQGLNPFGGLFGGLNPLNIPMLPSFTIQSVALVTPSFDPLAQLRQVGHPGLLNPYDPFSQQLNPFAQQFGQLNPFAQQFGPFNPLAQQLNPFGFGGRQIVRAYVQTHMGLIPIDLVV